jgi:hypothetical protein
MKVKSPHNYLQYKNCCCEKRRRDYYIWKADAFPYLDFFFSNPGKVGCVHHSSIP